MFVDYQLKFERMWIQRAIIGSKGALDFNNKKTKSIQPIMIIHTSSKEKEALWV